MTKIGKRSRGANNRRKKEQRRRMGNGVKGRGTQGEPNALSNDPWRGSKLWVWGKKGKVALRRGDGSQKRGTEPPEEGGLLAA